LSIQTRNSMSSCMQVGLCHRAAYYENQKKEILKVRSSLDTCKGVPRSDLDFNITLKAEKHEPTIWADSHHAVADTVGR